MRREEQLTTELNRVLSLVAKDQSVKKVILFGSSVDLSNVSDWSDIDICLIQETNLRFLDRVASWIDKIEPEVGMDLVVYTPDEFEKLKTSSAFVTKEIVEKGKELYAA